MAGVGGHLGVLSVPFAARLGVEPPDAAGAAGDPAEHLSLGGTVVVAGVAGDDHRGGGPQVALSDLVPELAQHRAVVGVAVVADHVGVAHDLPGPDAVLGGSEQVADLVDGVDEHEAAGPGQLGRQGAHQAQGEQRHVRDGAGDVAEHEQLGPLGLALVGGHVDGHSPGGDRLAGRAAQVDPAAVLPAPAGQTAGETAGQWPDGVADPVQVGPAGGEEVDVGQVAAEDLVVGVAELGSQVRGDQPLELVDAAPQLLGGDRGIGLAGLAHHAGQVRASVHPMHVVALASQLAVEAAVGVDQLAGHSGQVGA